MNTFTAITSFCVIIGRVARDLFEIESSYGHRTYQAAGHFWTGVECFDSVEICSDDCLTKWATEDPWPVELDTTVEFHHEGYECWTGLNPETELDAVAYPFLAEDHETSDYGITCAVCGNLMAPSPVEKRFIETAVTSYLVTLLWSSTDQVDEDSDPFPLDSVATVDDIDEDSAAEARSDVEAFIAGNWADVRGLDAGMVGMDFWLTRNGHGAGFWDRGLGAVGDRLTEASKAYGSVDPYLDVDGNVAF